MLQIHNNMKALDLESLINVYGLSAQEEQSFVNYLQEVFFRTKGAVYCIWVLNGCYVSALRLEPYADGMVLAGLKTAKDAWGKGYATALIRSAMEWLGTGKVYSHIHHYNKASIAVHQRCGFRKISDTARLLDGSVSSEIGTYLLEMERHIPD